MSDPFANAAAGTGAADPFGTKPSEVKLSDFPKFEEFFGKLLVIQPTKYETGLPDQFNPGQVKDRITADVTVIDTANPTESKTVKDMYISQGVVVGQVKDKVETRGMLLGRLLRFPSKQTPKEFDTPEKVEAALARNPRMSFAWKLADWTEEDKAAAMVWYRSKSS